MHQHPLLRIAAALALGAGLVAPALAGDDGTIVSSTAVFNAVSVPQNQCVEQQQTVQSSPSGAGALLGALVGGGAGHGFGGGSGRGLATGIGVVAGALIGNQVEAHAGAPVTREVQHCQMVSRVENRIVGYDVVYDFHGQRYSTRMPTDPGRPGDPIALNVSVSPVAYVPPPIVTVQPAPVVYAAPPMVVSAPPVVVGPVLPSVGLSIEAEGGWGGHGRHWR